MKILLRDWMDEQYVWKTAKYNRGSFYVDGEAVRQTNIVSIINDNRKNYIQCSCCGQVFKKGDEKFLIHKANAVKPETCFGCVNMIVDNDYPIKDIFVAKTDGTFVRKTEQSVRLTCSRSGMWSYDSIDSEDAIRRCKKRQCADATQATISDFFTQHPGVFDDIITIDTLLDNGYDVHINDRYTLSYEDVIFEEEYIIGVAINKLGIVDRWYVWVDGDRYIFFYSKKYDELYCENGPRCYEVWNNRYVGPEMRTEIKAIIKSLYN